MSESTRDKTPLLYSFLVVGIYFLVRGIAEKDWTDTWRVAYMVIGLVLLFGFTWRLERDR